MRALIITLFVVPLAAQVYPDLSGYTWVQQESATLTQNPGKPPVLYFPNTGNKHEKMLMATLPSCPYTVVYGATITQGDGSKQVSSTLVLRDSATDKGQTIIDENEQAVADIGTLCCKVVTGQSIATLTGVDVDSVATATFLQIATREPTQRGWTRVVDDCTHRTYYSSHDEKTTWIQEYQTGSTTYLTPNQVGIGGFTLENSSFPEFYLTVWEFSITASAGADGNPINYSISGQTAGVRGLVNLRGLVTIR